MKNHFQTLINWVEGFSIGIIIWLRTFGYFIGVLFFDKLGIPEDQLKAYIFLMVFDIFTGFLKVRKIDKLSYTSEKMVD